jgi:colanic acid biosynthesis glycosyl transferase WcaI
MPGTPDTRTDPPASRRLLCVYQHAPTPGAPGIYRHRLYFAELVRRGWHVDLVSTPINYMTGDVPPRYAGKPYVREVIDGIVHHWVWASGKIHGSRSRRALNYGTFAIAAGLRAGTLRRPDVVLASSPPLPVGTLGVLLSKRYRRPWILEVRDVWPESAVSVGWLTDGSRLYRALERLAHHHASTADAVIVPTPGLVDPVSRHGAAHVDVVPGSVLDAGNDEERRARARAELGIDDDTCLFVYVGAVGLANGLDMLVDAVRQLAEDRPARFLVVGDGSARTTLERRLAAERIDRIQMLDAVPKDRVADLLAAADVCLHLLRPDSVFASALPTKMLEYFGAHRPFITTVPGLPSELAEASGGGSATTLEGLTAELRRWLSMSPAERRERGEASYRYGSQRFGLEATVDNLEQILLRVIGQT